MLFQFNLEPMKKIGFFGKSPLYHKNQHEKPEKALLPNKPTSI